MSSKREESLLLLSPLELVIAFSPRVNLLTLCMAALGVGFFDFSRKLNSEFDRGLARSRVKMTSAFFSCQTGLSVRLSKCLQESDRASACDHTMRKQP